MIDKEDYIYEHTPDAALYEQLAEESVELAHACLKAARAIRKESPTPVTEFEALKQIHQEYNDVLTVTRVMGIVPNEDMIDEKMTRWARRIEEQNAQNSE